MDQLRAESDHEATFFGETVQSDPEGEVNSMSLYTFYRRWCRNNGYNPVCSARFKNALLRMFPGVNYTREKDENQRRVTKIEGISLQDGVSLIDGIVLRQNSAL